jgi:hypothetical protein
MDLFKQSGPTKAMASQRTSASAGRFGGEKKDPPLRLVELQRSYLLRTYARRPHDQC